MVRKLPTQRKPCTFKNNLMTISKLHIRTFGCQMNEYDSNKMSDVLKHSHGLDLTDDAKEADVLLLNTCSIREKAEEKLFHQLGRWKKFKDKNPNLVIGVGGCVASQEGELILKRALLRINSPSCEATQPPTPITKFGFLSLNFFQRPSWWNNFSSAFSLIEHVLSKSTSASFASSVRSSPCECLSTSLILLESYSFIWHPKVRICNLEMVIRLFLNVQGLRWVGNFRTMFVNDFGYIK